MMVGALVCNRRLMVLKDAPLASRRISLARKTYPAGKERDWAMLLSFQLLLLREPDFGACGHTNLEA